jgi:hypothetical protein
MRERVRRLGRRVAGPAAAAAAAALGAAALGAAAPAGAGAQAAAAPAGCTYDTCALRRERVFFSERLLAGARGTVVARPRAFGAFAVDSIVRGVPEAVPHAERYRREQRRGQLLTIAGSLLSAAAVIDAVSRSGGTCAVVGPVASCERGWRPVDTALLVGGVTFNLLGGWRLQVADRSLNRAIWHYNRALPR